jgi:hypothetical protein
MEQVIAAKFSCGGCGQTFRWRPEVAGKTAKCACGAKVTAPANPPAAGQSEKNVVPVSTVTRKLPLVPVARTASAREVRTSKPLAPVRVSVPISRAPAPAAPIPPAPIAAPAATTIEEGDGSYDLAHGDLSHLSALIPTAEQIAAAERETPPTLPLSAINAAPLEYHRSAPSERVRRSGRVDADTGELNDPVRDWIVPAILLTVGLLGFAYFLMDITHGRLPMLGLAVSVLTGIVLVTTLVKTAVMIWAAVPLATYCDVNVGLLRTAILKLA